ncbi:MAG: IgGFc-binding protein [Deltaproteobacteria bacterium]|jgi:hypothetical protein|nr:IgGFc-binding protein [Deltaproteobacteria bacterium]MBW2529897.1 IgGFc-binding protein [Deltaproteobacteria bacterium]
MPSATSRDPLLSHRLLLGIAVASLAALLAVMGCAMGGGTGGDSDGEGGGDGVGASGIGANGTGADAQGGNGTGGDGFGVGSAAGPGVGGGSGDGRYCTADLGGVVDDLGNLLETCGPDEGCYRGDCLPACEAAAAQGTSVGCEFYVPTPPFTGAGWPGTDHYGLYGACHAMFVANGWHRPAKLTLRYEGQVIDVSDHARIPTGSVPYPTYEPLPASGLPPGEVAIVFLSHDPEANNSGIGLTCPVTPAMTEATAVFWTGRGFAFELASDTPITAYDILPYGGAHSFLPSATLLMPKAALGTEHLVVAPHDESADPIYGGKLWLTLVGTEDNTTIEITPRQTLPMGPNMPLVPAGQTTIFHLRKGQTLQWGGSDPTGTIVHSSAPIGVFTGSTYLWVTAGESADGGRDAAHQQLPPLSAMAHEYVGAGVVTRCASLQPETSVYRLVGVVDGTQLSWDPAPPSGAPTTLAAGQVVEFETKTIFHVSAQDEDHPFSLTQYMTGSVFSDYMRPDGTNPKPIGVPVQCGIGDEEWTRVLSPRQFLHRYVFFTDPKYATTTLVITRRNDGSGFQDVHLGCLGPIDGWQPVGSGGRFEVAHVDLVRRSVPNGQCDTSQHEAVSMGPFGVTVWGTDWCSSYAYPAGGAFRVLNTHGLIP